MHLNKKDPEVIQVWDLPLRLFHWLLVLGVLGAYVTADYGGSLIDWHGRFGALVLGLLIFRVIWGFTGTLHARFASFVPTPTRIVSYLNGDWHGQGHTPISGLAVFALLGTLLFLAFTGLFANDDIAFQGPWLHLVAKPVSDSISGWHAKAFEILKVLLILHIAAIGFYQQFKKRNLVKPMLTGNKPISGESLISDSDAVLPRFLIAIAISVAAIWVIYSGVPGYLFSAPVDAPALAAAW
ncbi:MAG: cytochrome b/b6 domain-containing protein [Methylobacter sp.]